MFPPESQQINKAKAFLTMHSTGPVVLLPNVWDVASARIVEDAGFSAIATTSAGMAFAHGFPDGQAIPNEQMFAAITAVAAAVELPVTADVEAGYGDDPESAARTARNVIQTGAVGMNFEDATGDVDHPLFDLRLQLEKITAIRETANNAGVPLVLNARTDVYLLEVGDPTRRYDAAVQRLQAYREAGADCVFVPGVRDAAIIGRLVADVGCPVNILAVPGGPSIAELTALGVRRISLGSGPMRAAMGLLRRLTAELKATGTYTAMADAPSHAEMNELMRSCKKRSRGSSRPF